LTLAFSYSHAQGVLLNEWGHIKKGNQLFNLCDGWLSLEVVEENVPSVLRIYDNNGMIRMTRSFNAVINLCISANKEYVAFFSGKNLIVFNVNTLNIRYFPQTVIFAVSNDGFPLYYQNKSVVYKNIIYLIEGSIPKLLFFKEKPIVFAEGKILEITSSGLQECFKSKGKIFEAKISENSLYFVVKHKNVPCFSFLLFHTDDLKNYKCIDKTIIEKCMLQSAFSGNELKTTEKIYAPLNYGEMNWPFRIGNSYAEIQTYNGYSPYLHPGIDFLGTNYQHVYAVKSGIVKAILTTSGDLHWRIAIADVDTNVETTGYLYAHLNESSIPFNIGDTVNAGDILGTLVPWGFYNFTHVHFARILCSGEVWNGQWWTTDNPLVTVTNLYDATPPVFENAYGSNLFAFRADNGTYLDHNYLTNNFVIIAKCYDVVNTTNIAKRVDIWDLHYSLYSDINSALNISNLFVYAFNWPLGFYAGDDDSDLNILTNVYSRDITCYSRGNYEFRNFYHLITNSVWLLPTGDYTLEITARDASLNQSSTSMIITIIGIPEPNVIGFAALLFYGVALKRKYL